MAEKKQSKEVSSMEKSQTTDALLEEIKEENTEEESSIHSEGTATLSKLGIPTTYRVNISNLDTKHAGEVLSSLPGSAK